MTTEAIPFVPEECPNPSIEHPGYTSDGFHTFDDLYMHRMILNATLFNEWARQWNTPKRGTVPRVVKSFHHSDGEPCFGGEWFIVVAELPIRTPVGYETKQISYHYKKEYYHLFHSVTHVEIPPEYDGHTPTDVINRLIRFF